MDGRRVMDLQDGEAVLLSDIEGELLVQAFGVKGD